jgi:hypothetical protein
LLKTRPEAIWPPIRFGPSFRVGTLAKALHGTREDEESGRPKTALGIVRESFALAAACIAFYDPDFDPDGRVLAVALA